MSKELEALKPCPFCGGEAHFSADHTVEQNDEVQCRVCCFQISGFHHEDPVSVWNTRQAADQLERYRVALETIERANDVSPQHLRLVARQALEPKP